VELVRDDERVVELELSRIDLPEQLDHHRHFHRRRRMKARGIVDSDRFAWFRVEWLPDDSDVGRAALLNQLFDLRACS